MSLTIRKVGPDLYPTYAEIDPSYEVMLLWYRDL